MFYVENEEDVNHSIGEGQKKGMNAHLFLYANKNTKRC